jgi:hypothetical protein
LKADFSMDLTSYVMVSNGLVVLAIHMVKMTTCFITALCCKMPVTDALCISLILNTKGVVEVGVYNSAFDDQVLHLTFFRFKNIFSSLIIRLFWFWPPNFFLILVPRFFLNFDSHSYLKILANIITIRATL